MEQLRDIYGFDHVPFYKQGTFFWSMIIVAMLLCALVVGIGYYLWQRRKHKVPYWQDALNQLHRMFTSSQMSDVDKEQFFTVSRIVKTYCARRYNHYLDAKTDNELLEVLEKMVEDPVYDDVKAIFSDATYIKYAGVKSQQELLRDLIRKAERVIEATREKEESSNA